ncbi:putative ABC transporter ATP-binding protein [Candidatus Tiddalikarchaeum anstoanum]|nr:putative ABC transporter ATP-binding protein [Candidatus Tiddalikarchaeum anstoanum]
MITIKNLNFKYSGTNNYALRNINLEIKEGELAVIIGSIGSGKSTLAKCINGLIPHFVNGIMSGEVEVAGIKTADIDISDISKIVGMVLENPLTQLTGYGTTVEEEIAFGLENLGLIREEMKNRINSVLKLLDIEKIRYKDPFDISGGQQQRVVLASVLAMKPKILVLDDPTSQLDPSGAEEVFEELKKLKGKQTIILITQKMNIIRELASRVIVMSKGKIVKIGKPIEVLLDYKLLKRNNIEVPAETELLYKMNYNKKIMEMLKV